MKGRYLEVTYRKGRPLAAYLHLPRPAGAKAARTMDAGKGMLVDYAATGEPIGLEITHPSGVTLADVNAVLEQIGASAVTEEDLAPLDAA